MAGLLFLGSPALLGTAVAQDLEFEQVGNIPLDADDLVFDQAGTLWADAGELYRLISGSDVWEEVNAAAGIGGNLLVLSPDSILLGSTNAVFRSVNGGDTFDLVYKEGGTLFATEVSGFNHGVLLSGEGAGGSGIAYSTDRGASFTEATFTPPGSSSRFMETAVEIPDGSAEGRLVAGVFGGVVLSEDSGQTWSPSSLFQDARFWVQRVEIGTEPGTENRRLYATLADATLPDVQFYFSDDNGLTWTNAPDMEDAYLFVYVPQGEGYLLAAGRGYDVVTERIPMWRSEDGGQSWVDAGQLPAIPNGVGISPEDMLIGPLGHLYISVDRNGPEHEWVYRTTEPVVVANEPEAPPRPAEERLLVYPNPAGDRLTVEAAPNSKVVIYDVLGRVVVRSATPTELDVSGLPPGVYIVRTGANSQIITIRR